jgi:hypothetical protein
LGNSDPCGAAGNPSVRRVPGAVRRGLVIASVSALLLSTPFAGLGHQVAAAAANTDRAASASGSLSSADQGAISATVGRDDPAYWVHRLAGVAALANPGQHLTARFMPTGAGVSTGDARWGLGLAGVGHGDELEPVPAAEPVAEANRVSYRRGSISEWYVNGPAGLEQGFTLGERPGGDPGHGLTLALGSPSSLTGRVDPGGTGLVLTHGSDSLAYRGLSARDSAGTALPARLELHDGLVLVRVDDRRARYPITVDPFVQAAKLVASDGFTNEQLGFPVAVSGNTVVAGVEAATVGTNAKQGAVYVFTAPPGPGGTLNQVAKLTASDGAPNNLLGSSVAIDGTAVVAGAPAAKVGANTNQGAAYVFVEPAGGWAGGARNNDLGISVGVSGGTVVVGAYVATVGSNAGQGAGYVFVQPPGGWAGGQTQTAKLTASDGAANDELGSSVAITGNTAVFGVNQATVGTNSQQGAGYVFVQPPSGWAGTPTAPMHEAAKLTASDGAADDRLGESVGISGGTVVAGAYAAKVGTNPTEGAVYVFVAPTGGWAAPQTESAKLTASDGGGSDMLGNSVGISGNTVLAGSPFAKIGANFSQGAAYLFVQPAAGWAGPQTETEKLTAADGATGDKLGFSVAISGTTLVAGAPTAKVGGITNQGAAYVFENLTATSTTLSVTPPSPAAAGTAETLTATITPATAGTVQFLDGSTPLGAPVAVSGGTASLITTLAFGPHSLSAMFTPLDPTSIAGSTSPPVPYTVNQKRPLCIRICG